MTTAFIIGNGASRLNLNLSCLVGTVFGCNALYRDYPDNSLPDFLVAIDAAIITEILNSDFPKDRFINPPEAEKWEPVSLHWAAAADENWTGQRPRSNAGANAILEAIKRGFTDLYILGFDALVVEADVAMSNVYDGSNCYGLETRANLNDTRNRLKYLAWIIEQNPTVNFHFCFPSDLKVYKPEADNCFIYNSDKLMGAI